jgi:hypothetical protein
MFATRYFNLRMFARRYFPKLGGAIASGPSGALLTLTDSAVTEIALTDAAVTVITLTDTDVTVLSISDALLAT